MLCPNCVPALLNELRDVLACALATALFEHCRERLAYYKLPGYIVFVDRLPTTSTQKMRKHDLGPLAMRPLDHSGCHDLRALKQRARGAG